MKSIQNSESILVRAPNWIGDHVLAYPFFHYLRKTYPSARIAVACVPWVQAVQFRNLVDEVFVLPQPLESDFFSKWRVLEEGARILKDAGPWDIGVSLPNSFSAAWLLYRSKVKRRRGYSLDGRGFLLNDAVQWPKNGVEHRSEAYARLIPQKSKKSKTEKFIVKDFWGVPADNELDPGTPGVLNSFDAEKAWPQSESLTPPHEPYWVLAPGSTAESRRWPAESFLRLARIIAEEKGWKGIIVGGGAESLIAEELAADKRLGLMNWTARGTVASYWKVFRNAKMTLSNDSGLAHVASLCGSRVQMIWGAGNPKRTKPMGPGLVEMALNPVDCWPCERNQCTQVEGKKLECLRGLNPDAVWTSVKKWI